MRKVMRVTLLLTLVASTVLVLAGPPGHAAFTPLVVPDDPSADPDPWNASIPFPGGNPPSQPVDLSGWGKGPNALGGCDTIDPVLTQNRNLVAYRCTESADLLSYSLVTIDTNGDGRTDTFRVTWTSRGRIPKPGDAIDPLSETFQGLFFDLWFQAKRQNGRHIAGDTVDCQRYAHWGPYLQGNNEYLSFWVEIAQNETDAGVVWNASHGWSHYDPVGLNNYLIVADPAIGDATRCNAGRQRVVVPFAGTKGTPVRLEAGTIQSVPTYTNAGRSISIDIPFNFSMVDNQKTTYDYVLAQPGDLLENISAQSSALVDTATTPELKNPATGAQLIGEQGVSNTFLLDWVGYNTYDLGLFTPQAEAVYGPTCPYFVAAEYTPGQARQDKAPFYANLGKGPAGQDNDAQLNPLYPGTVGGTGLQHYDGLGTPGLTNNQFLPQDHKGVNQCDIAVVTAARLTASGADYTA